MSEGVCGRPLSAGMRVDRWVGCLGAACRQRQAGEHSPGPSPALRENSLNGPVPRPPGFHGQGGRREGTAGDISTTWYSLHTSRVGIASLDPEGARGGGFSTWPPTLPA